MFKRRKPLAIWDKLQHLLAPQRGWRRRLHYFRYRVLRLNSSPHSIAAGLATGVGISFTPFIPHILSGGLIAWVMRGNLVAMGIGTLIGNPWTFPFLWLGSIYVGQFILGGLFHYGDVDITVSKLVTLDVPVDNLLEVYVTWAVGAVPFFVASWLIVYFTVLPIIRRFQSFRAHLHRHPKALKSISNPEAGLAGPEARWMGPEVDPKARSAGRDQADEISQDNKKKAGQS